MEKKFLDDGTVFAIVDISNLIYINTEYNRQVGDDIIKIFTSFLKEAFGKTDAEFIYNGNGSFVILVKNSDYITVEDILRIFSLKLNEREDYKNIRLEYKIGIAETFKENKTARKLLSEAIKNKKEFESQIL
jgi:GGDEF domain-containing protein